jgi:hypothetical protein
MWTTIVCFWRSISSASSVIDQNVESAKTVQRHLNNALASIIREQDGIQRARRGIFLGGWRAVIRAPGDT